MEAGEMIEAGEGMRAGGGLTPERAALVALSAAIAGGREDRIATRLAEAARVADAGAVEEVVLQSYLFVGFPGALNALALWRARVPEIAAAAEAGDAAGWAQRGEGVCRQVYGAAYAPLRRTVRGLHPDLERWMLAEGYGKVLGRAGLGLATRELCIVGLLAGRGAPRQLHSHLRGCLNVGVAPDEVEAALAVALAEVAATPPRPIEEPIEESRSVWLQVRARHDQKMSGRSDDPETGDPEMEV